MSILSRLSGIFGPSSTAPAPEAATLTPPPLPKAPNAPVSYPGYRKQIAASSAALRDSDRGISTLDRLVSARSLSNTKQIVRQLFHTSPELSSAITTMLRVGIPERYTVVARDLDGKIDVAATGVAHELLRRVTFLGAVDGSFGTQQTVQSLSEQLGLELIIEGAACLEVALDKARIPASFNPIACSQLRIYEENNSFRLTQVVGGQEVDLDLPTIIYTSVDQDLLSAYSSSYMEAAIPPVLSDLDFNNDMRRALKRAVLPRLAATIDGEKVKKLTPPEILSDATKFNDYKIALIAEVENVLNGLSPEDALVSYDSITYSYIDGGKDPASIIERIQGVLNSKLASGAKTLPVVLGHGGTSNSSSTEAVLYLKQANIIRVKLNEIYSRALTIAVRLLGNDAYVEFIYAPIDLRPDAELEAFKSMEQSRILELLSLGLISDEEACIRLTGNLPPAGYKPLAGTMFKTATAVNKNPTSNTSAIDQSLTPKTPKEPKGSPSKAESDTAALLATAQQQTARAMDTADRAVSLMQDITYAMGQQTQALGQQTQKPVQVSVESQPITLNLQMEQEKKPANKTVKVVRDEDGRVVSMKVVEAEATDGA